MDIGSLEDIWPLQAALNRQAGFDTEAIGRALAESLTAEGTPSAEAALAAGQAIKNYLDALDAERSELRDCLSWKHWYREAKEGRQYQLTDLQNARVEAIDILFFWISICQLLGLAPADVYRLYEKKLGVNRRRQQENRTQAEHADHEHENRQVE